KSMFETFAGGRAQGIVLIPDAFLFAHRARIAELAREYQAPLLGWRIELVRGGALMSYGANYFESGRSAAAYVDKILQGAKPADLPVEQPTKFELIINRGIAKTFSGSCQATFS